MKIKYKCPFCRKNFEEYKSKPRKFCSKECKHYDKSLKDYKYTCKILDSMSKEDIIWFTGFWEGEGTLCQEYNRITGNYHFIFSIAQQDKIIIKFKNKFKFGKVSNHLKGNCLQWLFGGAGKILAMIEYIGPFIKLKKRQKQIKKFLNNRYVKNIILQKDIFSKNTYGKRL